MKSHFKCQISVVVASLCLLHSSTLAMDLLIDGDFEAPGTAPLGWSLDEFATGSGTVFNSAEQIGFTPQSGALDLWLRAFVGGQAAGPDNLANAILSQSVGNIVGGEEYTFSGWSRWEEFYSGGATTLDPTGPLGAVASPTSTRMELAFLDSGGAVVGTPVELDLATEQSNLDLWRQHTLVGTAPNGAVEARVTAEARDMVWNGGSLESAFYDNFSLTAASDSNTELLINNDLEDPPPAFGPAWVVTEVAGGNIPGDPTIESRDFANRPESGGALGVWLRAFTGSAGQPADGFVSQTVPGVEGGEYTFSGWSRWESNYSGGAGGFGTETIMEVAFLDSSDAVIGTPEVLDLSAEQVNGGDWVEHMVTATAPAGTAKVRVTGGASGMVVNPAGGQQSAFFDDFALMLASDTDADGDGDVDGDDFLMLQRDDPSLIPQWVIDYGSGGNLLASLTVPEPTTLLLTTGMLALLGVARRRPI